MSGPGDEVNPRRTSRTRGGVVLGDLRKDRDDFTPEYQAWLDRQAGRDERGQLARELLKAFGSTKAEHFDAIDRVIAGLQARGWRVVKFGPGYAGHPVPMYDPDGDQVLEDEWT